MSSLPQLRLRDGYQADAT